MDGGLPRSRDLAGARAWWRTPVRAGAAACLTAVLVAVLIGSGRPPATEVLANAAAPQDPPAAPPTQAPVQLPHPTGRQVSQPASLSSPNASSVAGSSDIPGVALAAYQRSSALMGAAAPSCGVDWALLAAIGQVESDHGQANGSHLDANGVARPAIVGPRLDGRHGTSRINDTDAGRLDGDHRFDRAVGPMQFLPSTWAAVAVDGDDDGQRDVQDIDDAALGSAVYLCADHDDLTTRSGQRRAVLRYNHSQAYADHVLSIAQQLRSSSVLDSSPFTVEAGGDLSQVILRGPDGGQPVGDPGPDQPHATGSIEPRPSQTAASVPPTSPPGGPTGTPTSTPTPTPTPTSTSTPTPTPTPTPNPPSDPRSEAPVLTDPLPDELADLTPEQVAAYNAAWATCDDELTDGWSVDTAVVDTLTQCLADAIAVPVDDTQLTAFVDWLTRHEDPVTP